MASLQSTSRLSVNSAFASGRCRTMQPSGLCLARSMAPFNSGMYSMTRLTSMPQDAVIINLGLASSMRTASSLDANPPKTTEWTAPMRAQANMAMAVSGTMGM